MTPILQAESIQIYQFLWEIKVAGTLLLLSNTECSH